MQKKRGTERETFQIPEDDTHKAAEGIMLLTRTDPFQLPLFLQITPKKIISVPCPNQYECTLSQKFSMLMVQLLDQVDQGVGLAPST